MRTLAEQNLPNKRMRSELQSNKQWVMRNDSKQAPN